MRQLRWHPVQLVQSRLDPTAALLTRIGSNARNLPAKLLKSLSLELPKADPPHPCPRLTLQPAHPPPPSPQKFRYLSVKSPSPHPRLTPTSLGSAPMLTQPLSLLWQAVLCLDAQLLGSQLLLSPRPSPGFHPHQKFLSASLPGCCWTMTPVGPCQFLCQLA